MPRLLAATLASTTGLAFWWGLTEPLPLAPALLLGMPAVILGLTGVIAGRLGALAAPLALLFSLLLGSIIATQLHQAFVAASPPVAGFGGLLVIGWPSLARPLTIAAVIGGVGGLLGERMLPTAMVERIRARRNAR